MAGSPEKPKSPSGAEQAAAASPQARAASPQAPAGPSETGQAGAGALQSANVATEGPNINIVPDEDLDESYDLDDNASSSASITSSVLRYRYENGRRYHAYKDGSYIMPNDDTENDRLDLQHYMFQLTLGGKLLNCPADPEKMHRVLDIGTGTGSWAIDFADEHPNVEVIGLDLSAIQPSFVPPNVRFYVDDIEDAWTFNEPFDLIFCRMMTGSIADFPKLFKRSFDNLAPGGWIEVSDSVMPFECDDDTMPEDSAIRRWSENYLKASIAGGKPFNTGKSCAGWLAEAGFTNIVDSRYKWPSNHWPKDPSFKELGILMYENAGKNLSGISLALFTRFLGWTAEELEVSLIDVRKEMKNPMIHSYCPLHIVYAQKPL